MNTAAANAHDVAALSASPAASGGGVHVHTRDAMANIYAQIAAASTGRVSKAVATQVPAYVRAWKLYTHTVGTFPLREYIDHDQVVARNLLTQPSPLTSYSSLMSRTVGDLLDYDVAYWRVIDRAWDGYPTSVQWLPAADVTPQPGAEYDETGLLRIPVAYQGVTIPVRDVIRFDGDGLGGWLSSGAAIINTAAALEAAALRYAEFPAPSIILKNTGADLPADQVDDLLTAWENARASRSTAYLNSVINTEKVGFNPNEMQLVEARNASATAIARLANIDPVWVGAGVPGSSLTYTNRVDLYRQLLDLSLTPVMDMIAGRLSMQDVTPRGHTVKFDTSTFLRANPTELADYITKLLPVGVLNINEARALIDLPPEVLDATTPA